MSIEELGSIGELIAAIATVLTLAYLAMQLRQNTRALKASTFQDVSGGLNESSHTMATSPELAALFLKARDGLDHLSDEERLQHSFFMLMTLRRLEAVRVHRALGTVEPEWTEGIERSVLSVINSGGSRVWWEGARGAFSDEFVAWVDARLAREDMREIHPGLGGRSD